MRKIAITHNPYRLKTDITIDGAAPKANSRLQFGEHRLQEWIETLPQLLVEECNTKEYEMTFHGTLLDYEDVEAMAQDAAKQGINIALTHIPAKEVADKEEAISQIFSDIQAGPFDELKQPDVVNAFNLAKNSDFPVDVVATMSAGKSTLINALLRQKLMPAKNEACTATITEIRDNDSEHFMARVYDKDGKLIKVHPELTFDIMNQLNSDANVSTIRAEGDIPFLTTEEAALVLVDTPGPNNSRDPEHKVATYKMLSESSKNLVLYIMNATQLETNDDKALLSHVAQSMSVGGKQSRDRFIFVVNKLDEFKDGEDNVEASLNKVRTYLHDHGIDDPNIYPASAWTALAIRTLLNKDEPPADFRAYGQAQLNVQFFTHYPEMHFEQYAPLTSSMREQIDTMLAEAKANKDANAEALIHCGIIPIELAIQTYVRKYSKTKKIKNIVDTFFGKLESAHSFESTKQEITKNQNKHKEILETIDHIKKKLESGENAKKFKSQIDKINYDVEIKKSADIVIAKAQTSIQDQIYGSGGEGKISKRDAEMMCTSFARFADNLQAEVQVQLEELITKHIHQNASDLLNQYSNKLSELAEDIQVGGVNITPFEIMNGDMTTDAQALINSLTTTEQVKVGEEWVENTNKRWWKPWTWFQEKGHYRNLYEDREFVDSMRLSEQFFAPIQEQLFANGAAAVEYAQEQTRTIKREFSKKFDELDHVLQSKLHELEEYASDQKNVEKRIKETEARLAWLENIKNRTDAILDI